MKNLLLLIAFVFCFVHVAVAQTSVKQRNIRKATEEQVERYQLDPSQADRMAEIQAQRLRNLASIESLKQRDYERYLEKKRAVRLYVESATRGLLHGAQLGKFERLLQSRAQEREEVLRALKVANADRAERRTALLRLEESWD